MHIYTIPVQYIYTHNSYCQTRTYTQIHKSNQIQLLQMHFSVHTLHSRHTEACMQGHTHTNTTYFTANAPLWSTNSIYTVQVCIALKGNQRGIIHANMGYKTEKLAFTVPLVDFVYFWTSHKVHKTCRIFLQVRVCKEIICEWLFQLWLSQCSSEEGTSSSGNNLGLDRLSNLFIETVPSQQTYLPTSTSISYLLTGTAAFSRHILWMISSKAEVTAASVCYIEILPVVHSLCLWLWLYMELPIHSE